MSCIVFLKNIKIDDYRDIEDEFNDRLLQDITNTESYKTESSSKYDIISPIFESIEKWPKTNNIRCWTCDFTFTSIPVFVPLSIKQNESKWCISVLGNFCTFNCACRYIIDYLHRDLLNNLIKLYDLFYNVKVLKIEPSPNRHIMEKYGGFLTEEQYLSQITKLSRKIGQDENIKKKYVQDFEFVDNISSEEEIDY